MLKFLSLYFFQCGLSLLQDVWASAGRLKGWGQKWSGGSLIHTSGVHTSAGWCQLLAKMSARAVGWTPTCGLFMWCELFHNGESGFWGPVPQVELNRRCVCVCVCVCVHARMHTHITSDCLWPYGLQSARLPSVRRVFRQRCWSGLSFPPSGIFMTQESNPSLLFCRRILFFNHWATGEAWWKIHLFYNPASETSVTFRAGALTSLPKFKDWGNRLHLLMGNQP